MIPGEILTVIGISVAIAWILSAKEYERDIPGQPLPFTNVVEKRRVKTVRNKQAGISSGTGEGSAATAKG